jgi:NADPH:quinone reductase-like Zn-dependent oxidoreductase
VKAIVQERYGPPHAAKLDDVADPTIGDGEVLIEVRAAGVDPGIWHLMTGLPYLVRVAGFGLRAPKQPVIGRDVSGLAVAVGSDVDGIRPGDEVFGTCDGAFAEYAVTTPDRIVVKPPEISHVEAASVPTSAGAALQGLCDRGQLRAGQRLLVIGAAGGVGSFAVQLAVAFGARVTGVCSTRKLDFVRGLGADEVWDHTRHDFTRFERRFDLVLDLAGQRSLTSLRRLLEPSGTLVIIGGEGGTRLLGGSSRQLRAVLLSLAVRQELRVLRAEDRHEDLLTLRGLLSYSQLVPVVSRTFTFSEAPDAVGYVHEGHAVGKVAVTI